MTYLVQNRPVAAVQLLVGLGEDAPDLEVALLAVEGVRGEVHVASDGHHELGRGITFQPHSATSNRNIRTLRLSHNFTCAECLSRPVSL